MENFDFLKDPEFDEISWIKKLLKTEDKEHLQSKILQEIDRSNDKVETLINTSFPTVQKTLKDLRKTQQQTIFLKSQFNEVRKEFQQSQEETGQVMENIIRLNQLSEKLESAKISLQESDGWGNLITTLEDCFEKKDLTSINDNMVTLQRSLVMQESLPGHTDRISQVEDFKNRMEAIVSPHVVQAFIASDLEKSVKFVEMFHGINRKQNLIQYYRAVHKKSLQQKWREIVDLCSSSNNGETSIEVFEQFYEFLISFFQKQEKWCVSVFGSSTTNFEPVQIFIDTLPSLQPSRETQIMKNHKEASNKLEYLQSVVDLHKNFGKKLLNLIGGISELQMTQLGTALYDCLATYLTKEYVKVEEQYINEYLESLKIPRTDSMQEMENANQKLFDYLTECIKRCSKVTNNYELAGLVSPFESSINVYLKNYSTVIHRAHLSVGTKENWNLMQSCLSILQNLADAQKRVIQLSEQVSGGILLINQSEYGLFETYMKSLKHSRLVSFQKKLREQEDLETVLVIFPKIMEEIATNLIETHEITINILVTPIEDHLKQTTPSNPTGSNSADLPAFSFAPQENITQIGQYLLTLPQHLEPLLLTPSKLLHTGLEMCNEKYSQSIPCSDVLLSLVVEQCCHMFLNRILQMKSLNPTESKQISVDIEYLKNIIEDLGLTTTVHLQQMLTLLQAPAETYLQVSSGCEPKLVTAVRQMRNVKSTSNEN
ncbi:COG7 family protein [Megaselia abdita]